jgi:Coenzyme PQQ synthesis protein D (PqqD)
VGQGLQTVLNSSRISGTADEKLSNGENGMDRDLHLRVNTPAVTHEVIDGEAVIINLVTGNYYSLEGAGAEIWTLLQQGHSVGQVVDELAGRGEAERSEIESGVVELAAQFQQEQLMLPCKNGNGTQDPASTAAPKTHPRQAFRTPVLHKFTDMQELLILDPIHEVDAAGWPHKKPE